MTVSHPWETHWEPLILIVSDAAEQGVSVAKNEEDKLKQALRREVIKDPKLGKPTEEKLNKILDKAKKNK